MQITCLRKSGRKWDQFCRMLPQTVIGGRRAPRPVGKRVPRLIRENSEPWRIRTLLEITLGEEAFWSPFQGVASEYQEGFGMCAVPCVQGYSLQRGVGD